LGVPHKSNCFFFANNQIDWPITKETETMEAPKNRRFYGKIECLPPLAHLYRWEGEDFGQNIWDWSEVLLGNTLGEHVGNKRKMILIGHEISNRGWIFNNWNEGGVKLDFALILVQKLVSSPKFPFSWAPVLQLLQFPCCDMYYCYNYSQTTCI